MISGIDHVVILVDDLADAQVAYTALGFTVTPGGAHSGGLTHNALIPFEDGSYIELIAFIHGVGQADIPGGISMLAQRWLLRARAGEGLLDYALLPTEIEGDIAAALSRGLSLNGPLPGGRRRPDGQEVAWSLAIPPTPDLPFLCADVTPRELRVPTGEAREHQNGATGVARVGVAVSSSVESATRYRALSGREPEPDVRGRTGARSVSFQMGQATITLVEPTSEDDLLREQIETRSEGPYEVILRTARTGVEMVGRLVQNQFAWAESQTGATNTGGNIEPA